MRFFNLAVLSFILVFQTSTAFGSDNDKIEDEMSNISGYLEHVAYDIYETKQIGAKTAENVAACIESVRAVQALTPDSIASIGNEQIRERALSGYVGSLRVLANELESLKRFVEMRNFDGIAATFQKIDEIRKRGHNQFKGRSYKE